MLTLFVLLHAEENWRGRRAWNQCRRTLEAQGKQLDFMALIPKPVPEEQNFAAAPFVQSWFRTRGEPPQKTVWSDDFDRASSMVQNPGTRSKTRAVGRHFTDLPAWKLAFAAVESNAAKGKQRFQTEQLDRDARDK